MNLDFPLPFIIATIDRSGFYFLSSLINSTKYTGQIGTVPGSLRGKDFPTDERILLAFEQYYQKTENNESWGLKIAPYTFNILQRWLELTDTKPQDLKWIWLKRRNAIAQAISFLRAEYSKVWRIDISNPQEKYFEEQSNIEIDLDQLNKCFSKIMDSNERYADYFKTNNITPHFLFYEDFIDESCWSNTVANILDFLGISYQLPLSPKPDYVKQSSNKIIPL